MGRFLLHSSVRQAIRAVMLWLVRVQKVASVRVAVLAIRRRGFPPGDRLVGLVVEASASRAEDPRFESHLRRDFFGVESYE